jgi:hypothetical protein
MPLWGNSMKKGKQLANRKIRRKLKDVTIDISDGNYYRHIGIDRWDLYEFKFYETEKDVINNFNRGDWIYRNYNSVEEALIDWKKSYKRK